MNNITDLFNNIHEPKKIITLFQSSDGKSYFEAYDLDKKYRPINAHPFSLEECIQLANILKAEPEFNNAYLKPSGLLPENVLYLYPDDLGYVIWYTPPMVVHLHFIEDLNIGEGTAAVPGLIWKADKKELTIFALKQTGRPTLHSHLYKAPFFNIHQSGKVCMGSVNIDLGNKSSLEEFVQSWQEYFYSSNFSHLIAPTSPVRCNIIQLWKDLIGTKKPFPAKQLIKTSLTLKDIIQ